MFSSFNTEFHYRKKRKKLRSRIGQRSGQSLPPKPLSTYLSLRYFGLGSLKGRSSMRSAGVVAVSHMGESGPGWRVREVVVVYGGGDTGTSSSPRSRIPSLQVSMSSMARGVGWSPSCCCRPADFFSAPAGYRNVSISTNLKIKMKSIICSGSVIICSG